MREPEASPAGWATLQVSGLGALALAQPMLDLLARQPEYLAVQGFRWTQAAILAGILVLLVPLLLLVLRLAVAALLRRGPRRSFALRYFDAAAAGLLVAVLVLPWVRRGFPGPFGLAAAATLAPLAGLGAGWLFLRYSAARAFVSFLIPAVLLVPLAFLLDPEVRRLGRPAAATTTVKPVEPSPGAPPVSPVVLVVFDELSQSALLNPEGQIDPLRYPRLSELAARSTWFEHAFTVAKVTVQAVPALLTGDFPEPGSLPVLEDHPSNLFTLLGGAYRIEAQENTSRLCPPGLNAALAADPEAGAWTRTLVEDLAILYGHLLLPRTLSERLPAVDQGWGNFTAQEPGGDRLLSEGLEETRQFMARLNTHPRPTLYYIHVAIPHLPLKRLPTGATYLVDRPRYSIRLASGNQLRRLFYQRYLLQVGLVDRMVGELLDRLDDLGQLDPALLIITSDHGVRLLNRPGSADEDPTRGDWLRVPLLIKRPFQDQREVISLPATTLDILPTVLDLVGVEPPAELEGRALFRQDGTTSARKFLLQSRARLRDDTRLQDNSDVLSWIAETYGPSSDPDAIFRASGPRSELWGQRVEDLRPRPDPTLSAAFDSGRETADYDPESAQVPVLVRATLSQRDPEFTAGESCCDVALAVNGVIEATTKTFDYADHLKKVTLLFPPRALRPGPNDLELFVITEEGGLLRPAGSEDVLDRLRRATHSPFSARPPTLLEIARGTGDNPEGAGERLSSSEAPSP